jgi:hypothetical protein
MAMGAVFAQNNKNMDEDGNKISNRPKTKSFSQFMDHNVHRLSQK